MRLAWGLTLGAALGVRAGRLAARQIPATTPAAPLTTTSSTPIVPIVATSTPSSTPAVVVPTTQGQSDSLIVITRTVTLPSGGSVITSTTTVTISTVITVAVTTTDIATTTITRTDNETATKTIYVTSTLIVNAKRAVEEEILYTADGPAQNEAQATPVPAVLAPQAGDNGPERARNNHRRAVVTQFATVTEFSGGGDSTVVLTATQFIRSTTTALVHTTSFVTETNQVNAKTTITTTATIILKLTHVSIGYIETATVVPTRGADGGDNNNHNNNNPDTDTNGDSGLSSGAKAGIGAGLGVAALIAIGVFAFCLVQRRRSPKLDPDDLLGPSSEVPVGGGSAAGGSRSSRPMSQGLSSAPGAVPGRSPILPNVQPEGYRGTAMGNGRAGYAKPETYPVSYGPTRSMTSNTRNSTFSHGDGLPRQPTPDHNSSVVSPLTARPDTAELGSDGAGAKWHQTEAVEMPTDNPAATKWHSDHAHEMDGQPVTSHQSGPVYEMPTENYR
ncbi:hypothetical protein E4U41_007686 [Claviceps citrina]|nr:hypothetical protein E4U41_007686 [Claviceps citrina]